MRRNLILTALAVASLCAQGWAQLPPDAVKLGKVKISESQKSDELCPVHLVEADASLPTWTHDGVKYRGHEAGCQAEFEKDPAKYAKTAAEQRFMNNFVTAMSTIWCPVTDEVTPGGMTAWIVEGVKWESCCQFCDESVADEDFPRALDRLKERAKESFELTGGRYVEGASSPVEGAIDFGGGAPAASSEMSEAPHWMRGKDLQPTYVGGAALIFENRCVNCHRDGGLAPMAFTTHGKIRKWTKSMKTALTDRTMPPWPADPYVGKFANSNALTQKELDVLVEWADAGYPLGEGEYKPESPFDSEWNIGEPDHVFTLPEHTVGENLTHEIKEFEVVTDFGEDRWIVATQIKPGNDYNVGGVFAGPLGFYQPGATFDRLHNGTAYLLKAGAKVTVSVLYTKESGWEITDPGTQIGIKFAASAAGALKAVNVARVSSADFTIPAGEKRFEAKVRYEFEQDGQLVSILPIMNMRGKDVVVKAITPEGNETFLLSIPHWDPAWKLRYELSEPFAAPKGTIIETIAHYDNSATNVKNPDASIDVKSGPSGEVLENWIGYTTGG